MFELDITDFFNSINPKYYFASRAEIGQNAGRITWENAVDRAAEYDLLDTEKKVDAFKNHIRGFGAWTDAEISAWSHDELNALFIQLISAEMREGNLHAGMSDSEWREYETLVNAGQCSGNIFGGPLSTTGRVYYSLD